MGKLFSVSFPQMNVIMRLAGRHRDPKRVEANKKGVK